MTTALLILTCLLAVVAFIQIGALVELYEQLRQVRAHLDLVDRPTPLELGVSKGVLASSVGLPAELDRADKALVLFLSNKCETCFQLASTLNAAALPPRLWLVVVPVSGTADEFVEQFALRGERVLVDEDERIVNRLGLDITPSAVRVEDGRLAEAQTVPTVRQLHQMLPASAPRRVLVPKTPSAASTGGGNGTIGSITAHD